MITRKILLAIIFLIIPLSSADIISINSGGNNEFVVLANPFIEQYFFTNGSTEFHAGGGGGGTSYGDPSKPTNLLLCEKTYDFLNDYGNSTGKITSLLNEIQQEENVTIDFMEARTYINNWQSYCSVELNRSLQEDFVCNSVKVFLESKEKISILDIRELWGELKKEVNIPYIVLTDYVANFNEKCRQEVKVTKKIFPFLLLLLLIILIVAVYYHNRRRLILAKKRKKPKK